jgi:hypothetical protein
LSRVSSRHKGFFSQRIRSTTWSGDQEVFPKQGTFVYPYFSAMRLVFGPPKIFLRASRDIFAWQLATCFGPPKVFELTKTSSQGDLRPVLARPRTPFGLPKTSLLNAYFCTTQVQDWVVPFFGPTETCLGLPKELIASRERSRYQSLWSNRDIFISPHVHSHGSPKDVTEATSMIYFSLVDF